jgi:hypothetical protein
LSTEGNQVSQNKRRIWFKSLSSVVPPYPTEPLQQAFAVLVRGGHAEEPPRRAQDESRQQGQIVKKKNHDERNFQFPV